MPLSHVGVELLFEVFSPRYDCLAGALLERLIHYVHILEMNGEGYRLAHSRAQKAPAKA